MFCRATQWGCASVNSTTGISVTRRIFFFYVYIDVSLKTLCFPPQHQMHEVICFLCLLHNLFNGLFLPSILVKFVTSNKAQVVSCWIAISIRKGCFFSATERCSPLQSFFRSFAIRTYNVVEIRNETTFQSYLRLIRDQFDFMLSAVSKETQQCLWLQIL